MLNDKASISFFMNPKARKYLGSENGTKNFSPDIAESVRRFHRSIDDYQPTPLIQLKQLATRLHLQKIWIKDESHRFGLNSFKALGAVYGIAHLLVKSLQMNNNELSFEAFKSSSIHARLNDMTVVTASDGNHGKAVAWAAKRIGCNAVVYFAA